MQEADRMGPQTMEIGFYSRSGKALDNQGFQEDHLVVRRKDQRERSRRWEDQSGPLIAQMTGGGDVTRLRLKRGL